MARITKTLQLVEGMDDDLIAWFESLSKGDGQRILKDTLRNGINCNPGGKSKTEPTKPQPPTPERDNPPTDVFVQMLNCMKEQTSILKKMERMSIAAPMNYQADAYAPSYLDDLADQTDDPDATREAAMNVVNMFG